MQVVRMGGGWNWHRIMSNDGYDVSRVDTMDSTSR
jgi:hypothetical protein